jgi:hypothetical protein
MRRYCQFRFLGRVYESATWGGQGLSLADGGSQMAHLAAIVSLISLVQSLRVHKSHPFSACEMQRAASTVARGTNEPE